MTETRAPTRHLMSSGTAALAVVAILVNACSGSGPAFAPDRPAAVSAAGPAYASAGPLATESGSTGPEAPGTDPTIIVAGDIAGCGWNGDQKTARLVSSLSGLVMTAGDNVYESGTRKQFRDCYAPTWGAFLNRTRPTLGNHDWVTPGAAGYFGYFGKRAGPAGRGYYAFDIGTWRVYALVGDCWAVGGCGWNDPQANWLRTDLNAHPAQCVLAVWHEPLFSSGPHGNDGAVRTLWKVLMAHKAEVVVNGHDHQYERFERLRADGSPDAVTGIREFVVGTGGAPLYGWRKRIVRGSEVRNNRTYGVLQLTLHTASYDWQFVPVAGQVFTDSGSEACH